MRTIEVTTASSKGQVVIPAKIRKELGIIAGTNLIVMSDGDNLLMKPIQSPKVEVFKKLARESRKLAREHGMTEQNVKDAIHEVRSKNRS
jgi:antitoxin PrlF